MWYNDDRYAAMQRTMRAMRENKMKTKKKYLIALEETRSIVALAAGVLVFFCTLTTVFVALDSFDGTG